MMKNDNYYRKKYTLFLQQRQLRMYPQMQEVEIRWSWLLAEMFYHKSIYNVKIIMRLISFINTTLRYKQDRQVFEQMKQKIYEQIRIDRKIRTLLSKQGSMNSSSMRYTLVTEPLVQNIISEPYLTWSCTCHEVWRIQNMKSSKFTINNFKKIRAKSAVYYKTPKPYNRQTTIRYTFQDMIMMSWFLFTFYHNNQTYMGRMTIQSKKTICCGKMVDTWNDYGGGWIRKTLPFESNVSAKFVNNLQSCVEYGC